MIGSIFKKVIGTSNDRELKRLSTIVEEVRAHEPRIRKLTDDGLRGVTGELKTRLDQGASLDDVLPDAFAVVREAAVRVLGQRHFDVQVIGGLVLHQGKIAEMKTGEGKTLAATMPVYLNALTGKGVHVVTVNDYLAGRDAEWMGRIYRFLGLEVGCILNAMDDQERRPAYGADITYGTNNEFGFDYLRDNMKFDLEDYVQREFHYAIVDEVDSILIDEARTPLIISGPAEESTDTYSRVNRIIPRLTKDVHYTKDEKARTSILTEEGVAKAEQDLNIDNLYDPRHMNVLHHLNQALRAHALFTRDVDYIVKEGQVIIVDEFTGRLMPGRRYSDGLHQALEAKEGVRIENENQTLASITFQNYFRMYEKLAGMTGTADTEAPEFAKIYNLDVVVIPTHKKMIRKDFSDVIYRTEGEKYEAVADEIEDLHEAGQPVLVGTISISTSERVSKLLKQRGVPHEVLNAKHHEREAQIVSQAGQKAQVTISTNMAGRGTDIVLGEGVPDLGGLHILGTERHESRRIDNQLRGRSGRQGDPGSSRFYLSLEDDLLRIFGGERIQGIMSRLGMEEGEPIENQLLSRAIENSQRKVEGHNFDIRKNLLEFDDVMNQQREVIYTKRRHILSGEGLREECFGMIEDLVDGMVDSFTDEKSLAEGWDLRALSHEVYKLFNLSMPLGLEGLEDPTRTGLAAFLMEEGPKAHNCRPEDLGGRLLQHMAAGLVRFYLNEEQEPEKWNYRALAAEANNIFNLTLRPNQLADMDPDDAIDLIISEAETMFERKRVDFAQTIIHHLAEASTPGEHLSDDWDPRALVDQANTRFGFNLRFYIKGMDDVDQDELREILLARAREAYERKTVDIGGEEVMTDLSRFVLLRSLDNLWKDHLLSMDHLKEGIGLRGYGQRDPLREYQREGYEMFADLIERIKADSMSLLFHVQVQGEEDLSEVAPREQAMSLSHGGEEAPAKQPVKRKDQKVGRNAPCPCGSGKKYKKCCGANQ